MLRCRAMKRLVRRVVMAALWLGVAVLISFGAAGIVSGMRLLVGGSSNGYTKLRLM